MSDRTVITIPLAKLQPNPYQPASREDHIEELAASINDVGLIHPITVVEQGEGYIIVSGHQRVEAILSLGWSAVPAEVWHNDISDRSQLVHMLKAFAASNTARKDFTVSEKAQVYQTMFELGLDEAQIEKATGDVTAPVLAKVSKGLAIAGKHLAGYEDELTLDQLVALQEFADDLSATDDLIAAIQDDNFARVYKQLQVNARAAANRKAAEEALSEEGTAIVAHNTGEVPLEQLGISPANHRSCDGHCASVRTNWDGEAIVTYACTQPKKHNYKPDARPKSAHEQQQDEKAKAGREFKKECLVDYELRHDFVKLLLTEKDPAKIKGLFPFLAYCVTHGIGAHLYKEAYDVLGKKIPMADNLYGDKDKDGKVKQEFVGSNDDFCPKNAPAAIKAMIARTCTDINEQLRLAQEPKNYRTTHAPAFLALLKANGYRFGDHDQKFVDAYAQP